MKKYRTIYMLEGITESGSLHYRLFAANKRAAERIARRQSIPATIRKLNKWEHDMVNPSAVQR